MENYDFIEQVRAEFAELAAVHGMREVNLMRLPVFQEVVYSNGERMVDFSLDRKDGFISCVYGDASILDPEGLPRWPESEALPYLNNLLREEGIDIPEGIGEFQYVLVPEAVRTLVDGLRRHQTTVFGRAHDFTNDFVAQVRAEFAELATAHGMREVHLTRLPIFQKVVYSNGERMASFTLDIRDGYISCMYGSASILDSDGLPRLAEIAALTFMNDLLRKEGIDIPDGYKDFDYDLVPESLRTLVDGLRRHQATVFGREALAT